MSKLIQLKDRKFGRLTVVRRAPNSGGYSRWLCKCECGRMRVVFGCNLVHGRTVGCGRHHQPVGCNRSHGNCFSPHQKETPEYAAWRGMIQRCLNPNNKDYNNYGGRGISISKRWRRFENFLSDMDTRPINRTLDRKNVNGNYCKRNCRWATWSEQANNRRKRVRLEQYTIRELKLEIVRRGLSPTPPLGLFSLSPTRHQSNARGP